MSMYKEAVKKRLTFDLPGSGCELLPQDLWGIPLTGRLSLDALAIHLNKKLKEVENECESFVTGKKSSKTSELELAFEIVKDVIKDRKADLEAAKNEKNKATEKQKILEILSKKDSEELESLSKEDLLKRLKEM